MIADFRNLEKAFAFFTIVAGTEVLAVRLLLHDLPDLPDLAIPLIFFGAVLWFIFGYVLPWQVLMTRDGKPILARTNGTWFIWAVASQSLANGTAQIQPFIKEGAYWVGITVVLSCPGRLE